MTKFVNSKSLLAARCEQWGWPVICKNRRESGGRGLLPIYSNQELAERCGDEESFILEKFIDAPEISIESFVQSGEIQFTNITEYFVKKHINILPGHPVHSSEEELLSLNKKVIESLGITSGITHVEVYLTPKGPLFGEIALRPPGGYIMELLRLAYGFNPWEAYVAMVMGEEFRFPTKARYSVAGQILHPGAGEVQSIEGVEAIQNHPQTQKVKIKARPGALIGPRSGAGEDLGYVLQRASTDAEIRAAIEFVRANLAIKVGPPAMTPSKQRVS